MVALATPDQLGAYLQIPIDGTDATAVLMLSIAEGMVRDYLEMNGYALDQAVADVVLLDPINGAFLFLDGLPISAVTLVETWDGTAWTTQAAKTYTVSRRLGIISALPGFGIAWPTNPESWRVTYSHGFAVVPAAIVGVVLGVAARAYATPAGVGLERIGDYQVKYEMESDGLNGVETKALARYSNPRLA